jgi:preprotein translocase subunit SecG
MNTLILAIVFLAMSIGIFVSAVLLTNSLYTNDKTQYDCEMDQSLKSLADNKCNIFTDNKCRKGTRNADGSCESKGNVLPLLLFIFSLIFFLLSIFYFVKTFMLKHHK